MGGGNSKQAFRTAVLDLVNNQQSVATQDDSFWERYWSDPTLTPHDYFALVTPQDIHDLREKASGNLTALCFKIVERISSATATACSGPNEHVIVLNCVRLFTRVLPFLFEAPDWRLLFWSPANFAEAQDGEQPQALAQVLLNSLADLLFCPDFTVVPRTKQGPENPDDLSSLDSCEYIWEIGIGCTVSPTTTKNIDSNRSEILKLLITCFSEPLFLSPGDLQRPNRWLAHFTSPENRHVLPLLTSLINVICTYDPVGYGVPYYYALVRDPRGELVEASSQLLSILLDFSLPKSHGHMASHPSPSGRRGPQSPLQQLEPGMGNLFCSYTSRLHQHEDLEFIAKGLTSLLCNPLKQTYLPNSVKKIYFTQELYILFWKLFELNKKFLIHMLRSPTLFDLVVPLLHQLLETRTNPALVGMLHVGVFILLVLSGERNFGVRLNKPYTQKITLPDIPKFSGTHADLLFLVFHKIITSGLPRLQPLYDCLLTVMVNVSPYLKSLSMMTCTRLMHLMESFSTPWFLFAKPTNHYLVFYLLEILNNIIQYQFDGNTNLIYSVIRSKVLFYQLANLPEDSYQLARPRPNREPLTEESQQQAQMEEVEETLTHQESASAHTIQTVAEPRDPDDEQPAVTTRKHEVKERSPMPVPDIDPPGKIQTVEVEVEPMADDSEPNTPLETANGPTVTQEEQQQPSPPTPPPSTSTPPPSPSSTTKKETTEPPEEPVPPPQSLTPSRPHPPPSSSHIPPPHHVAGSPLPPFTSYEEPKPKKRSRPKPLSSRDLMPLHQDVGPSTKQLMEPATPEFKPTPDWVRNWKQKLPMNTILRVLQVLVPQVEKLCTDNNIKSEHEILGYLKNGTLVGLLPVPHPILIRKYQTSESTELWFHTYIWGVAYVRNFDPPIWYDTNIQLFQVNKV